MSSNPFSAEPEIALRIATLRAAIDEPLQAAIQSALQKGARDTTRNEGSVLLEADVDALCAQFNIATPQDLMLLALPSAQSIARPPISDFHVGSVGLEAETGNLIFGGNVEFPRSHLGFTLHGEGFVFTRAFSRGTTISVIAIGEAHPCAHCRQYLSEFAATKDLLLIDPLGHRLTMAQLLPWPFDPAYLGEPGIVANALPRPDLKLKADADPAVLARLLHTGQRAHAPYSKCPGALALKLSDGQIVTGSSIESVAFNPTISPIQAAMVDLLAHGYTYADIAEAFLATSVGGKVDYSISTSELLAATAPGVDLTILNWS